MKDLAPTFIKTFDSNVGFLTVNVKSMSLGKDTLDLASPMIDRRSVAALLKSRIHDTVALDPYEANDAFYVADLGELTRQHAQWRTLLPRVEPFYAVKCNPDPLVLKTLANLGTGFDCASKSEVQSVLEMGISPSRIIYANPCKQASHIRFASAHSIHLMTFDNIDELEKVKKVNPKAKMVLRILTDDSRSVCRFGVKFGASLSLVPQLLVKARELEVDVVGISFHVGSGCYDATAFTEAVILARRAFDIGIALGFDFQLLDIGGGFPGCSSKGLQFEEIALMLGPVIDELFPKEIRVIAEPGRYFVSSAFTLAVNIVARRVVARDSLDSSDDDTNAVMSSPNQHPSFMYYINDGMYGSFNCITFDHAIVNGYPLMRNGDFLYNTVNDFTLFNCSIWGPTCDSIDLISKDCLLPEMNVDDWLYYDNMGAYTVAAASPFNGFKKTNIIYTDTTHFTHSFSFE